ncbi:hypothetical protein CGMCC3_g5078 [Colletotrichum fructicola]|nr:uncharacterized protein CGMCC3_g5078 [Colletotrichum fructicola]KAE9578758.1 hypothetical protein CGMCC3_g5078 [Colletotrichum fructicola]
MERVDADGAQRRRPGWRVGMGAKLPPSLAADWADAGKLPGGRPQLML